jgi:molecular chaperone GrpE
VSRRTPHDTEDESLDATSDETRATPRPETDVPAFPDVRGRPDEDEGGLAEVPSSTGEVEALRTECQELRDALVRRRADFENYRKRVERDRHAAAQEALAAVFRELVGTVDNLERALAAEGDVARLRQGVELTYRELMGLLEAHDVVAVDPAGAAFDPTQHQALLHEPVPGLTEGTVAEVFRKGFTFGDRLLRPALVKVAKGDGQEGEE